MTVYSEMGKNTGTGTAGGGGARICASLPQTQIPCEHLRLRLHQDIRVSLCSHPFHHVNDCHLRRAMECTGESGSRLYGRAEGDTMMISEQKQGIAGGI